MTTLIIMIIYNSKNSNNNKNDNDNDYNNNNCHTKSENYALINFLLQPPPLHLHEYSDRASEGGNFEPCLSRAGNLNQKCQVFTAEVF